jgi:D-alanyl-D-alanine carboxypeptidase (penicillin-binding protein 5/6)
MFGLCPSRVFGLPFPPSSYLPKVCYMNRIFFLAPSLLIGLLVGLLMSLPVAAATILPPPPKVAGQAWILLDARTGFVITEHNSDERMPPASLTKLMTSYVLAHELAQGRVSNDDMVPISANAWAQNPLFAGSSLMWIEAGTTVRLEDLHRGVVISSGNDATVAVAEHLAGSEDAFADVMNGHAQALGMTGSHFVNSHGLPDPNHYTTARDLARLAQALINEFPEEYAIYSEREFTYNNIRQYNRNTLLAEDPSVDGLKTGYTEEAGYCLVASAQRQGMRLISVVLGTDSKRARKAESRKLINYGFRSYETQALYRQGEKLTTSRLWQGLAEQIDLGVGRDIYLTLPRGSADELDAVMEIDEVIIAPVEQGASHGQLVIELAGKQLLQEPLVALEAAPAAGFWSRLWDRIVMFFSSLFGS